MGLSKTKKFTVNENQLAGYAKALAHPARIAILKLLIKQQPCICRDLVDELPLSQSTVSQHLKELKKAEIIQGDIEGAKVCYCINEQVWQAVKSELSNLFESYTPHKCC